MERQEQSERSRMLVSFLNRVKYFLLVYFYVVTVDYGMKSEENTPYFCGLLFVFTVISFWGQQKLKRFLPFFLYQAAVVCGCTLIGRDIQERVLFFLFAALQWGITFVEKTGEAKRVIVNSSPALILLGIPGLLYAYVEKYNILYEVFLWVSVLFLWIHMWNLHLANRQRFFVEYAQNADSMEKGKMILDGNRVIGSFLGVAAVALFLGTQVGEGGLIARILQLLYKGLRWFLALFTHGEVEEYIPEAVETPVPASQEMVGGEMLEQNEFLSTILAILGAIFMFALKVLSVLFVVAFLVLFGYSLWKGFYKKQIEPMKEYEEVEKIREKVNIKTEKKREFTLFGNTNAKVRRLFQRKIEKQEKGGENSKKTKTSSELVDVVVEEARDTVQQMVPLYQKARYSREKISKEELEKYKQF